MSSQSFLFVSLFLLSSIVLSQKQNKTQVLIIGAGPTGLTAAMELNSNGVDFLVLEATDHILGRVRAMRDFADFPIELGQEYIHGNDHIYYRMARMYESQGLITMKAAGSLDTYTWVPHLNKMMTFTEIKKGPYKADLHKLIEFEDEVWDYEGKEMTIKDYKEAFWGKNEFKDALSTFTSNEKGASDKEIGILGVQEDEMSWGNIVGTDDDEYEDYFLTKGAMEDFLKPHFEPVMSKVLLNSPVINVDYSKESISVGTLDGRLFEADYVVVTVPMGVLKQKMILFNPELPKKKQEAIEGIGFSGGLKINIKLRKQLWPDTVFSIFSNGNGKIPLYWVTSGGGRSQKDYVLTAFFVGEESYAYENDEKATRELVVTQLSQMFKVPLEEMKELVMDFFIQNWSKAEYTKGAYSFIRMGEAYKNLRKEYAQNVQKKVFFAGEAASETYSSCVQGGMETAIQATQLIIDLINDGRSEP